MSGGVGPTCDISLPKAQLQQLDSSTAAHTRPSFFTFRQLNALAVVIVLSASGMVSLEEVGLVFFSTFYMYFISRVAFPLTSSRPDPPVFGEKNVILSAYVAAGTVIGLILPIAYIFHGIVEGDKEGIKAAAPHVFLLASQIFMEGLSFSGRFSLPIRAIVPVFYNSMRIFSILEWGRSEMAKAAETAGYTGSSRRLYVGKALAFVNMAFWSFNLLAFLLPVYLPRSMKMYYAKVKD